MQVILFYSNQRTFIHNFEFSISSLEIIRVDGANLCYKNVI